MSYPFNDSYNEKNVQGISFPGSKHDFISSVPPKEKPHEKPKETSDEAVKVFK